MKTNEIKTYLHPLFMYPLLCNSLNVINKGGIACVNAGEKTAYHFADVDKVIYCLERFKDYKTNQNI